MVWYGERGAPSLREKVRLHNYGVGVVQADPPPPGSASAGPEGAPTSCDATTAYASTFHPLALPPEGIAVIPSEELYKGIPV